MDNQDQLIIEAFETLAKDGKPTKIQKDKMLDHILMEGKTEERNGFAKWKFWIFSYPWRFALTASVAQAVILTLIFGTKYTNLLLSYFGG